MSNHSPLPWWLDDDGYIASGHGDDYITVGQLHHPADREFVIKAVNNYDRVRYALKTALDQLKLHRLRLIISLGDLDAEELEAAIIFCNGALERT